MIHRADRLARLGIVSSQVHILENHRQNVRSRCVGTKPTMLSSTVMDGCVGGLATHGRHSTGPEHSRLSSQSNVRY